jgi:hypothetical protein
MKANLILGIVGALILCPLARSLERGADLHMEAVYHYRVADNHVDRELVVSTIVLNRGEANALLPTANVGPSTAVENGRLRVNYKHFLRRLQGRLLVASPLAAFRPVEVRPGEALIIEYRFPLPAGKSLDVTVFFEVDEAVAIRYGFSQCALVAIAREGTIAYE